MNDLATLYSCMCLLHGNHPKGAAVDAVCVFGRALHDFEEGERDEGILELAARIYAEGLSPFIAINGGEGDFTYGSQAIPTSYPGKTVWINHLLGLGIPTDAILLAKPANNTREEARNFVILAKQEGWKHIRVISNPHQGLRIMLGIVPSLKECGCQDLRVTPLFPRSVSWSKHVHGSQGELLLPRHQHIDQEWQRIRMFQKSGDLCSFKELHEYLIRILESRES